MRHTNLKPFRVTNLAFWLGLLGMLLAIGAYLYLFNTVKKVGEHISVLQEETNTLQAQESEVGELKKNLANTQASQQKLTSYFIDANNIIPFLETIEGYGRATNVTVKFNSVDIKHSPNSLAVSITSNGTFANIYRFLALLEAAPYEFSIRDSSLQLTSSLAPDPSLKIQPATNWELGMDLSILSISGVN